MFAGCTNLPNILIPPGVTNIGNLAFATCRSLTRITIPTNVTTIGNYAFIDCTRLTSITIPDGVTTLGEGVFHDCRSLASVTLPNSLTSIGNWAFHFCTSLPTITIESVTNIGAGTFMNCASLKAVYFLGNAPSVDEFAFLGDLEATAYYLPGTTGWGSTLGDIPAVPWLPKILTNNSRFGVSSNQFGFSIAWAKGQTIVVETCSDMAYPVWAPISTNTLSSGAVHFSDPQSTNCPLRFYRLHPL